MCSLTEFTAEQLAEMIFAMEDRKEKTLDILAKHKYLGTEPESDDVKFWEVKLESITICIVQLRTAFSIVKDLETVTDN